VLRDTFCIEIGKFYFDNIVDKINSYYSEKTIRNIKQPKIMYIISYKGILKNYKEVMFLY